MRPHLDTLGALRAVADGQAVPAGKYAALQRMNLIRVRGNGVRSRAALTEAGRARLSEMEGR